MKEEYRLAVGADPGLAVSKHAHALGSEPVPRQSDVGDFVADVMNAARGVACEKGRNRRIRPERVQEFDLRVRQFDEDGGDAVGRHIDGWRHLGPERVAVKCRCGGQIGHGDRDMIESADHSTLVPLSPVTFLSSTLPLYTHEM